MIESRLIVTKQTPLARRGLVAAEHPLGARIGAAMLERGGNAVDAAVAAAFAMTVAEPFMSTIAGSGTMLVHLAGRGQTVALDFNGCAPGRSHETMFRVTAGLSRGLFAWPNVENAANDRGWLAVAVPGSVAGLSLALERYGTMHLRDVLQPAIDLARQGFVPDWYQTLSTARHLEELAAFDEAGRVYLRNARSVHRPPTGLEEGDRVSYPDLARTLELIARDGPDAFYRGAIAQAIHEEMAAHGGLITRDDLAEDTRCSLQAAIEAPRLHAEGPELLVDDRVGKGALDALRRLGHVVAPREETYATMSFAKPVGIRVGRRGLEAGLDHLRPAAAAGY